MQLNATKAKKRKTISGSKNSPGGYNQAAFSPDRSVSAKTGGLKFCVKYALSERLLKARFTEKKAVGETCAGQNLNLNFINI